METTIPRVEPNSGKFTFEDSKGGVWDVSLTLAKTTRVENSNFSSVTKKTDLSIMRPDKDFFMELLTDTPLMFAMIWVIVYDQSEAVMGIDATIATKYDEAELAFQDRLTGSVMKEAREVFWTALTDYYPNQKTALLTLMSQFSKAENKISMAIGDMEGELESLLDQEVNLAIDTVKSDLRKATTKQEVTRQALGVT